MTVDKLSVGCYAQHQVSKGMNIKTIENNWSTVIKGQ